MEYRKRDNRIHVRTQNGEGQIVFKLGGNTAIKRTGT